MTTTDTTDTSDTTDTDTTDTDVDAVDAGPPPFDLFGDELEVFDDAVDPRLRARWIEARRAEGRRRLYIVCAVAGSVALAVIAYVIAHSSLLGAGSIEVHGVPASEAAAIRTAAHVADGEPLLFLDEGAVARRVEALPTVARAQVSAELPSTVVIRVTQRTPVAWTRTVLTAPPVAVLDGDGRVLVRTVAPPPGLVQVAGVGVAGAPGSHVARAEALRALAALPDALRSQVTRLVLRPTDGPVLVLGGPDPRAHEVQLGSLAGVRAKATSALAVLDTLRAEGGCAAVLGVQVPDAPVTRGAC